MSTRSFARTGTGTGRGHTYVENPRKELSAGTPAPAEAVSGAERPIARDASGRPADREAAAELGRRGARKRAQNRQATGFVIPRGLRVGVGQLYEVRASARRFVDLKNQLEREKCIEIGRDIGDGYVGVGVHGCVKQWAHAHVNSLMLYELADGPLGTVRASDVADGHPRQLSVKLQSELLSTAAKLSAEARQALLTAHSLAAEEAKARAARIETSTDAPAGFAFITGEDGS